MKINNFVKEVHENAKAHGWWDKLRSDLEIMALIHSEISEAVEEIRKGTPPAYKFSGVEYKSGETKEYKYTPNDDEFHEHEIKPEGVAVELADAVIRIMDFFAYKNWDLEYVLKIKHEYNKTRSYRHGGKKY